MTFELVADVDDIPLPAPSRDRDGDIDPRGYRGPTDHLIAAYRGSRFAVDYERRHITGYWVEVESWEEQQLEAVFQILVDEMLKLEGVFPLHAAALAQEGRCLLLAGPTGSGKSTTALSFLAVGWRLLSDDHPFLRDRDGRLEILGDSGEIRADEASWDRIPELASKVHSSCESRAGAPGQKRAREFPWSREPARAAALIFPRIGRGSESCLEKMDAHRAMEKLLPCALLALHEETSRKGFELLARLVTETPCYRLHLGREVREVPELISRALDL